MKAVHFFRSNLSRFFDQSNPRQPASSANDGIPGATWGESPRRELGWRSAVTTCDASVAREALAVALYCT